MSDPSKTLQCGVLCRFSSSRHSAEKNMTAASANEFPFNLLAEGCLKGSFSLYKVAKTRTDDASIGSARCQTPASFAREKKSFECSIGFVC
jgi:hypothetical protein